MGHQFHDAIRIRFVLIQNHLHVDFEDSAKKWCQHIEARGLFFLDQVFEDADILGLQNLDREDLIRPLIDRANKTVEQEKLRRIGSRDGPIHF